MITCNQLTFRHNQAAGESGLSVIDIQVPAGQFLLVTGPSGCGKSTFTRCLNGMIPHLVQDSRAGEVRLAGLNVADTPLHRLGRIAGSVFQDPRSQFFALNVRDELAFGCENYGIPGDEIVSRMDKAITRFELDGLIDRPIFALSGGERQRVALASVSMMDPEVYILDEPSANLDPDSTERLGRALELLKKEGKTIVLAEHRFPYVSHLLDRVLYMQNGRIVAEFLPHEWLEMTAAERELLGLRQAAENGIVAACSPPLRASRAGEPGLEVRGLAYRSGHAAVLAEASITAGRGEIVGIAGKNGAGKTTFCKLLCGLLKESDGEIRWQGKSVRRSKRRELAYLVMQDCEFQLFAGSVEEELRLGNERLPDLEHRLEQTIEALDLASLRHRHPASLSGGQKQRTAIATAIMRDTPVLLLDEPTCGMDGRQMRRFAQLLKRLAGDGKLVLVVSHDREFMDEACDRVLELENGCFRKA